MTPKDKKIIEDAERDGIPIFVFTAKDQLAPSILKYYMHECENAGCNDAHIVGVIERIYEFEKWRQNNKVKLPD
jgi:hypothetical protein